LEHFILPGLLKIFQSNALTHRLDDIQLKNAGGAHLDLTICQYAIRCPALEASQL